MEAEGHGLGSKGDEPRAQMEQMDRWAPQKRWVFGQNSWAVVTLT